MFERKPYIAVIVLAIALVGMSWAVWTLIRYMFYSPIEPVRIADLPVDSTQAPRMDFSRVESQPVPEEMRDIAQAYKPTGLSFASSSDDIIERLIEKESEYALKARTRSAFDPVRDEELRKMLEELINARQLDEGQRLELALRIYAELGASVGDSLFKTILYEKLMDETSRASLENPELYPIRLAEVKSEFYDSKLKDSMMSLEKFDKLFKQAVNERIESLRSQQKENTDTKIFDIRDYLVKKTSAIEKQVRDENNGQDGDSM